jgi:hypothetical protein
MAFAFEMTLNQHMGLNHRAKRIGKVIPYKRSELRSIEVMEKVPASYLPAAFDL